MSKYYELAAKAHNNVYGMKIKPEKIKQEVEEIIKEHNNLITESAAFVKWLDALKLRDEYKKLQNEMKKEKGEKNREHTSIVDFVKRSLGMPDIMEIFGETRSLKTFTANLYAVEASRKGDKVLYIDTERNMTNKQIDGLRDVGCNYECIINFDKLVKFMIDLPRGYDVIILDSVGLPALGKFAVSSMHGKGQVLLNVQAILYTIKSYCVENGCYGLVVNQPTSEMGKSEYFNYNGKKHLELTPFGDKGSFFVKEIYRAIPVKRNPNETVVDLVAWGSRIFPKYKPVLRIIRKGSNLEVKPL